MIEASGGGQIGRWAHKTPPAVHGAY